MKKYIILFYFILFYFILSVNLIIFIKPWLLKESKFYILIFCGAGSLTLLLAFFTDAVMYALRNYTVYKGYKHSFRLPAAIFYTLFVIAIPFFILFI